MMPVIGNAGGVTGGGFKKVKLVKKVGAAVGKLAPINITDFDEVIDEWRDQTSLMTCLKSSAFEAKLAEIRFFLAARSLWNRTDDEASVKLIEIWLGRALELARKEALVRDPTRAFSSINCAITRFINGTSGRDNAVFSLQKAILAADLRKNLFRPLIRKAEAIDKLAEDIYIDLIPDVHGQGRTLRLGDLPGTAQRNRRRRSTPPSTTSEESDSSSSSSDDGDDDSDGDGAAGTGTNGRTGPKSPKDGARGPRGGRGKKSVGRGRGTGRGGRTRDAAVVKKGLTGSSTGQVSVGAATRGVGKIGRGGRGSRGGKVLDAAGQASSNMAAGGAALATAGAGTAPTRGVGKRGRGGRGSRGGRGAGRAAQSAKGSNSIGADSSQDLDIGTVSGTIGQSTAKVATAGFGAGVSRPGGDAQSGQVGAVPSTQLPNTGVRTGSSGGGSVPSTLNVPLPTTTGPRVRPSALAQTAQRSQIAVPVLAGSIHSTGVRTGSSGGGSVPSTLNVPLPTTTGPRVRPSALAQTAQRSQIAVPVLAGSIHSTGGNAQSYVPGTVAPTNMMPTTSRPSDAAHDGRASRVGQAGQVGAGTQNGGRAPVSQGVQGVVLAQESQGPSKGNTSGNVVAVSTVPNASVVMPTSGSGAQDAQDSQVVQGDQVADPGASIRISGRRVLRRNNRGASSSTQTSQPSLRATPASRAATSLRGFSGVRSRPAAKRPSDGVSKSFEDKRNRLADEDEDELDLSQAMVMPSFDLIGSPMVNRDVESSSGNGSSREATPSVTGSVSQLPSNASTAREISPSVSTAREAPSPQLCSPLRGLGCSTPVQTALAAPSPQLCSALRTGSRSVSPAPDTSTMTARSPDPQDIEADETQLESMDTQESERAPAHTQRSSQPRVSGSSESTDLRSTIKKMEPRRRKQRSDDTLRNVPSQVFPYRAVGTQGSDDSMEVASDATQPSSRAIGSQEDPTQTEEAMDTQPSATAHTQASSQKKVSGSSSSTDLRSTVKKMAPKIRKKRSDDTLRNIPSDVFPLRVVGTQRSRSDSEEIVSDETQPSARAAEAEETEDATQSGQIDTTQPSRRKRSSSKDEEDGGPKKRSRL